MKDVLEKGFIFFKDNYIRKLLTTPSHIAITSSIFEKYWERFAVLAASKTGKYHHAVENLKPFGLVNHTLRAMFIGKMLIEEENIDPKYRDDMMVALSLHDFGKMFVRSYADYEIHGFLGAEALLPELSSLENSHEIYIMIKNHMHHWHKCEMLGMKDRIVAYADFIASQKIVNLDIIYLRDEMFEDSVFESWK